MGPTSLSGSLPAVSSAKARPGQSAALGTNLDVFEDYSLEWPLVRTFKRSRVWISGERDGKWDDGRRVARDAEGWVKSLEPGQIARTLLFWSEGSQHPRGESCPPSLLTRSSAS